MNMELALNKQIERFYPLLDIPQQVALVQAIANGARFVMVPAGRRSGKTERGKRFLAKTAMTEPNRNYFAAAPTHSQAREIFWEDLKLMTGPAWSREPAKSEQTIFLVNGSTIRVIGLDKPQRIEGQLWHGGIIDEIADIKPDAWGDHIFPALDTMHPLDPDYEAWCWLTGVPDGLNHYYDMYLNAKADKSGQWKVFEWKSAEILSPEKIEAAKRNMSPMQFRQEYEASFETASGRIYCDYSKDNHTTETIQEHEQLLWYHDFNYTPMSSGIGVIRKSENKDQFGRVTSTIDKIYLLDEIILTSAVTEQSALEFCDKYKNHKNKRIMIYGDPAGRAGEKHGHRSDYTAMEKVLKENGWRFTRKVKRKAPGIKDRQNAVRAQIKNAKGEVSLFVNTENAPYTHKGLATTVLQKGSSFQEHEDDYQHITTAIGYFIEYEYPIKKVVEKDYSAPQRFGHNIGK